MSPDVAQRVAAMQEGRRKAKAQRELHASERVATMTAWQLSLAAVSHAALMFGEGSAEHLVLKKRHADKWHGVTFDLPSDYDYELARAA